MDRAKLAERIFLIGGRRSLPLLVGLPLLAWRKTRWDLRGKKYHFYYTTKL